jgi:hypothetical protein
MHAPNDQELSLSGSWLKKTRKNYVGCRLGTFNVRNLTGIKRSLIDSGSKKVLMFSSIFGNFSFFQIHWSCFKTMLQKNVIGKLYVNCFSVLHVRSLPRFFADNFLGTFLKSTSTNLNWETISALLYIQTEILLLIFSCWYQFSNVCKLI